MSEPRRCLAYVGDRGQRPGVAGFPVCGRIARWKVRPTGADVSWSYFCGMHARCFRVPGWLVRPVKEVGR